MTETVNIPVTLYRTKEGQHICSLNWNEKRTCPFLMVTKMGTDDRCFWDYDRPLMRDEDGFGWLIPGEKCPIKKAER